LKQHATIDSHRQGGPNGFLRGIAAQAHHYRLTGAGGLFEFDRLFEGELVVGIGNELDAAFFDGFPIGGNRDLGRGVGDALQADCDLHSPTSGRLVGVRLGRGGR
jgi:hypothetical protein